MHQEQLEKYRKKLKKLREMARHEIEYSIEDIHHSAANEEASSDTMESELALEHFDEEVYNHVNEALERIDNGTYGTCTECDRNIDRRRLNAIPYTPYCIECERKWEAESQE